MTTENERNMNQAKARIAKALRRQKAETRRTIESLERARIDFYGPFGEAYDNGDTEALAEIDREIKRINALQDLLEKSLEALK